jgi:hypothetical protein
MPPSNLNHAPGSDVVWRILFQKCGGKLYIHQLKLDVSDTGLIVMQKLRQEYTKTKSLPPYNLWDRAFLFWKPTIETVILSAVRCIILSSGT